MFACSRKGLKNNLIILPHIKYMQLYPLLFEPNLHPVVWGGNQIRPFKGLEPTDEPIGESWEVSAVPSSTSIISNGIYKGKDLISVINEQPEAILGKKVNEKYNGKLPLLVKFIDAKKDLSIQVHPNDEMAMREHGKMGKSEMWYVIKADEGAHLYAGFKQEITPEECLQRIANGTITNVLADHQVKAGDVFFLPAGRVHAICGGILLAEVQQSSDVTYRIYDYNRLGMDGKPRELHTELAIQALDYHVECWRFQSLSIVIFENSIVSLLLCVLKVIAKFEFVAQVKRCSLNKEIAH